MDESVSQYARRTGQATSTVRRHAAHGNLPARRIGNRWTITTAEAAMFLRTRQADGGDYYIPTRRIVRIIHDRGGNWWIDTETPQQETERYEVAETERASLSTWIESQTANARPTGTMPSGRTSPSKA